MKIIFKISYFTHWGQNIYVLGNLPELGNGNIDNAIPMNFVPSEEWSLEIDAAIEQDTELQYNYFIKENYDVKLTPEWGERRKIILKANIEKSVLIDAWNSVSAIENNFLTAPFKNVLFKDFQKVNIKNSDNYTHTFSVKAPLLHKNEALCIIGNCAGLGNWSVEKPLLMGNDENFCWKIAVNLEDAKSNIHYKYGVFDIENHCFKYFESGSDRIVPKADEQTNVLVSDMFIRTANNTFHGAGVSIPLFALRSERSFGVGDFTDLKLLADWAKKVGLKLIQVLPLNDTIGTHTDADVLPYAAISAFALNPLFLDLEQLDKLPENHNLNKIFAEKQTKLNSLQMMDFLSVINFKLSYAREAFINSINDFLENNDFKKYYNENSYWLEPYSVYCWLRDKYRTCNYRKWGEYSVYKRENFEHFFDRNNENFIEIAQNWYIQYNLHIQFKASVEYAHKLGIILKGDIPIGVNANSVDTWVLPELFNMNAAAGAPPDMFAVKGQNWELPTYNWEKIEQTDYDWWKKRFTQMGNYFDAFRIDHILGFFRIWEIAHEQQEGIMGHLNPSIPLYINEFEERGVQFDYERFCVPYITDHILWANFGEEAEWVKNNALYIKYGFAYRLKDEYATQTAVNKLFDEGKISERVKWGLFDLISNILLIEVPNSNGQQYYPRYGMKSLSTFRALNEHQKKVFEELYVDYFYRRQDAFWYELGKKKLSALKQATNMLICGEDLGMMSASVTSVMKELSILSLEIQRAPKDEKRTFFHPADAPYLSVVSPSTHDMSTIRGWWEEDMQLTQKFYNNELGHWGNAPFFCEWWVVRDILLQHLYSPAMWAIFQWQDLLGISHELRLQKPDEERINVPSNSRFSWRYRMHITLEKLLACDDFNSELKNYILQSGRAN
jgi:4-alpha-glucanotransferase